MKIEDPRAPASPTVESVTSESARPAAPRPGPTGSDAVHLSSDLQLVDAAVRAAALAGDVRPEAVANARKLLMKDALATDLDRLANRIIDSLLEGRDDRT